MYTQTPRTKVETMLQLKLNHAKRLQKGLQTHIQRLERMLKLAKGMRPGA